MTALRCDFYLFVLKIFLVNLLCSLGGKYRHLEDKNCSVSMCSCLLPILQHSWVNKLLQDYISTIIYIYIIIYEHYSLKVLLFSSIPGFYISDGNLRKSSLIGTFLPYCDICIKKISFFFTTSKLINIFNWSNLVGNYDHWLLFPSLSTAY